MRTAVNALSETVDFLAEIAVRLRVGLQGLETVGYMWPVGHQPARIDRKWYWNRKKWGTIASISPDRSYISLSRSPPSSGGDSSSSSGGGGGVQEHVQHQQLSLSSSDAFHQCGGISNPAPLLHHHPWEPQDMDYSSAATHHYMMAPPPPQSNSLLSSQGPMGNVHGHWTTAPGEHNLQQSSSLLHHQHHQHQQHCSDYQEPFATHIVPNPHVNLLHESPEEGRDAKRSAIGAVAPNHQGNGEEISKSSDMYKRPRLEQQAGACVPFKGQVRKEKLGERITALQQLVSPFGKTDTASVLQEAIGYIKFLQDQVQVLSTPYMSKPTVNLGSINHHDLQELGSITNWPSKVKSTDDVRQDLRSRGLCLVPVSCTLQVANDNGADFWTPAIGGGCR